MLHVLTNSFVVGNPKQVPETSSCDSAKKKLQQRYYKCTQAKWEAAAELGGH